MPNEVLPRYAKGERLRHGDWNRLAQTVEGHDRLVTGGGLLARKTGTALELYDPRMRPIDARITGHTGNAYSWEQVQQFEGGVYATPAGARQGTTDFAPAYARSGSTTVPEGTYVVLWPQFGGLFYLFDAPGDASTIVALNIETFGSIPIDPTGFTRVLFDFNQGVYWDTYPRRVLDATNTEPIEVMLEVGGVQVGDTITIADVLGNTAANGTFSVSAVNGTTVTLLNSAGNGAFQASPNAYARIANEIFIKGYPASSGNIGMVSLEDQHLGTGIKTVDQLGVGLDAGYVTSIQTDEATGNLILDLDQTAPGELPFMILRPGTISFRDATEDIDRADDDAPYVYISGGGGFLSLQSSAMYFVESPDIRFSQSVVGSDLGFAAGNPSAWEVGIGSTETVNVPAGSALTVRGGIIVGYTPP